LPSVPRCRAAENKSSGLTHGDLSRAALDAYCDEPGFGGQSGAYFSWCDTVAKKYEGKNQLDGESTKP